MSSDDLILSPTYGRNESLVLCLYCKRPKTVKAYGLLHTARAAALFGEQPLEHTGRLGGTTELKAPPYVLEDAVPCMGCVVRRELGPSPVLLAQADRLGRLTGNFLAMRATRVRKHLQGEDLRAAYAKGYYVMVAAQWEKMIRERWEQ